ncbi:Glyoxalase/Bleomycin resistance protein/Dioxygenase superfamily protein [compost metagenome]
MLNPEIAQIGKIDHLGIAVRSIEAAMPLYTGMLGLELHEIEEVADQKVRTAVFPVGESRIELLEPTSPDSPVAKFLEKRGEGIHHVAETRGRHPSRRPGRPGHRGGPRQAQGRRRPAHRRGSAQGSRRRTHRLRPSQIDRRRATRTLPALIATSRKASASGRRPSHCGGPAQGRPTRTSRSFRPP